jgi:polyferredoxin
MTDDFDRMLGAALAPPVRDPDAAFAMRVRALCILDAKLVRERRAALRLLFVQLLALIAVGAGLAWLGRAPAIADLASASPALVMTVLLAGFALLVIVMAAPSRSGIGAA